MTKSRHERRVASFALWITLIATGPVLVPARAEAAATTTFSSSFETGETPPAWTSSVETDARGIRKTLGVTGGVSAVLPDNVAAGVIAAQHLAELGHRQILVAAGPKQFTTIADRLSGIGSVLDPLGIRPTGRRPSGAGVLERRVVSLHPRDELVGRDPVDHQLLDRGHQRVVERRRGPVLVRHDPVMFGDR